MSLRIGILFGGRSVEKEVSLNSGRHIYNILDRSRFEPVPIFLDSAMRLWEIPIKLIVQNTTQDIETRLAEATRIPYEDLAQRIDIAFPITFGKYGEDGCLQGLLTLLKIPFVASGIEAAALGQDKAMQRVVMSANPKITIPPYKVIEMQDAGCRMQDNPPFDFPLVVKPAREGSTMGVEAVHTSEEWKPALERVGAYDNTIIIEPYLEGLEFSCMVIGNKNPRALQPTETVHQNELFSYNEKYMPGAANKITPARVDNKTLKAVQDMCVETYITLGFKDYARIDGFVLSKNLSVKGLTGYDAGTVLITDPNAFAGMAPSSWAFHQAAHEGWTPTQFITLIIDSAREWYQQHGSVLANGTLSHVSKQYAPEQAPKNHSSPLS